MSNKLKLISTDYEKKIYILLICLCNLAFVNAELKEKQVTPQYLFSTFTKGTVYLKGNSINTTMLNFNTLNEEMLFKKDTTTLKLDMPGEIDSVIIDNRIFVQHGKFFYEHISGKTLKLLVRNRSLWEPEGKIIGYDGTSKLAKTTEAGLFIQGGSISTLERNPKIEIYDDSWYYVSLNNTVVDATKLKNYSKFFPNLKDKIGRYTKSNKLNLKQKKDLIKLVEYINQQL